MPLTMWLLAAASAVFGAGITILIEGLFARDPKIVLPEDIGPPPVPPPPVWRQARSPFAPKEKPQPLRRRQSTAAAGGDAVGRTAASPPPKRPQPHDWPEPIERKPLARASVLPNIDWGK
jgi:hypothetical protein